MRSAIYQNDVTTIEKMIKSDGIDVDAVISVSIIITSYDIICYSNNYYKHTLLSH